MPDQIYIDGQQPELLNEARYVVGREEGCNILLPAHDAAVSRKHALLQCDANGQWSITDLASSNGTFVNGQQIVEPRVLQHGDNIQIGNSNLSLYAPRFDAPPVNADPLPVVSETVTPVAPPTLVVSEVPYQPPVTKETASPTVEVPQVPVSIPQPQSQESVEVSPTVEIKQPRYNDAAEVSASPKASEGNTSPITPRAMHIPDFSKTVEVKQADFPPTVQGGSIPQANPFEENTPFDNNRGVSVNRSATPEGSGVLKDESTFGTVIKNLNSEQQSASSVKIPTDQLLILRIFSWVAAAAMLVSLILPWVQYNVLFASGAFSYMSGLSMALSAGPEAILKGIQQEPASLWLFMPLIMTISLIGAAVYSVSAHQSRISTAGHVVTQAVLLLVGGVPGVLAAVYLFVELQKANHQISAFIPMDLSNFIGPGIPLFAIASFVATVAGVWALVLAGQGK